MMNVVLFSAFLLGGIVIGLGSLFLAIWFLTAFLKQIGVGIEFTSVLPSRRKTEIQSAQALSFSLGAPATSNLGLQAKEERDVLAAAVSSSGGEGIPTEGGKPGGLGKEERKPASGDREPAGKIVVSSGPEQETANQQIAAAIAATLCAGGFNQNKSFNIKEIRFVN